MKKHLTTIIVVVAIILVIVFKLVSNKREMESNLNEIMEYSKEVPVEVVIPSNSSEQKSIISSGIFSPKSKIIVPSLSQGRVIDIKVKNGDYIAKGDVIAIIDNQIIAEQLKTAKINLENSKRDRDRFLNLLKDDAITKQQMESAELNYQNSLSEYTQIKKAGDDHVVKAAISGYISEKMVEKGMEVAPGTPLLTINDTGNMLFEIRLPESEIYKIEKGDKAIVYPQIDPSSHIEGRVFEKSHIADGNGKYLVTINIGKPNGIIPGMSGRAIINLKGDSESLILPRKTLTGSTLDGELFVVKGDSVITVKVESRPINEEYIEILSGITPKDTVVLSGQINLEKGTKVKILNRHN